MRDFEIVRLSNNTFSIYLVEEGRERPPARIAEWLDERKGGEKWKA